MIDEESPLKRLDHRQMVQLLAPLLLHRRRRRMLCDGLMKLTSRASVFRFSPKASKFDLIPLHIGIEMKLMPT
jgi:hypothetical protein